MDGIKCHIFLVIIDHRYMDRSNIMLLTSLTPSIYIEMSYPLVPSRNVNF